MNSSKIIRYEANKRSLSIALVYCIFFGIFGMHRFYIGKRDSGLTMLILSLIVVGLPITLLWNFIDLFLLPNMVCDYNNELADKVEQHYYQPSKS
jgi:TM2 domain-containing membrane protein YozV